MANQTPTEEKLHYESLINMFKFLLGLASVIVAVAAFFIRSNIQDIRKDIKEELSELKPQIEKVGKDADKTLADTKDASKLYLDYTKDLTQMQISLLKEEAKNLALSSARNKVEEAFKSNNLQSLIDITARKEIADKLQDVVKEETEKSRELFNDLPQMTIYYDGVRFGDRKSLDKLDSISNYAKNTQLKNFAKKLLIQKGIDYDNANDSLKLYKISDSGVISWGNGLELIDTSQLGVRKLLMIDSKASDKEVIKSLVLRIKTEPDLHKLTFYYKYLSQLTGISFKNFDSKPVYDWHYSQ